MKTVHHPEALQKIRRPVFLAMGFFDGVHLGHRAVLQTALDQARASQGEAWALTFEPHPSRLLRPDDAPPRITSPAEKKQRLEQIGMDGCVEMAFTRELAGMEPESFFERLLQAVPSLSGLSVGVRASFGREARGDARLLQKLGAGAGIRVEVARQIRMGGVPVSSTRIRDAVGAGRMEDAARWLGRPFRRAGTVEPGRRVGRELGFPTANLRVEQDLLVPGSGVYAARAHVGPEPGWDAAAYLGPRPTFQTDGTPVLEVHLLHVDRDLYGAEMAVEFLHRIRGDRTFASPDALRAQIALDIEACRAALKKAIRPRASGRGRRAGGS